MVTSANLFEHPWSTNINLDFQTPPPTCLLDNYRGEIQPVIFTLSKLPPLHTSPDAKEAAFRSFQAC
jgi:hypothetical protein